MNFIANRFLSDIWWWFPISEFQESMDEIIRREGYINSCLNHISSPSCSPNED